MRAVLLVDETMLDSNDPDFGATTWPRHAAAEYSVSHALRKLGHQVTSVAATRDLPATISAIQAASPDFVFNMVEEIAGRRDHDNTVVQALDLMRIPYTGASPGALMLARNKHVAKLVVAEAGVEIPRGVVLYRNTPVLRGTLRFPAILKPLTLDGSDGVTTTSYVRNFEALHAAVRRLARWSPLLCEEYIPGRELIVTVSGADKATVESICELVFPEDSPVKYATASAKFDPKYRGRFGILYKTPAELDTVLRRRIHKTSKRAYEALQIRAYAKLEFRIDNERIVFIEANPNSQLSRTARTSDFGSIGYERFIRKIIRMAMTRDIP